MFRKLWMWYDKVYFDAMKKGIVTKIKRGIHPLIDYPALIWWELSAEEYFIQGGCKKVMKEWENWINTYPEKMLRSMNVIK